MKLTSQTGPGAAPSSAPSPTLAPVVPNVPSAAPPASPTSGSTSSVRVPTAPKVSSIDESFAKLPKHGPAQNKEIPFDELEFVTSDPESGKKVPDKKPTQKKDEAQTKQGEEVSAEDDVSFSAPEDSAEDETAAEAGGDSDDSSAESKVTPGKRDYSQYDPEVADVLKKLNNANYAKYSPKLQEWKKAADKVKELETRLATEKPRFLAEHPEAYKLSSDFIEAKTSYNTVKEQVGFWENQLLKISEAESWVEFTGYDDQGKPVYKEHPAPTDGRVDKRAELAVSRHVAALAAEAAQQEKTARSIAQNHRQFQQQSVSELNAQAAKLFQGTTPDKLKPEDAKLYKAVVTMLPGQFSDSPLAPLLGLAFVKHRQLAVGYQKALAELKQYKTGKTPAALGPRGKTVGGKVGESNIVDLDDLYNYDK